MKKKIFLGLGILFLIGIAVSSFLVFGTYSNGYRAGNVVKLSKKGFVIKTYEGQLNVGGFTEDEAVLPKMKTVILVRICGNFRLEGATTKSSEIWKEPLMKGIASSCAIGKNTSNSISSEIPSILSTK